LLEVGSCGLAGEKMIYMQC